MLGKCYILFNKYTRWQAHIIINTGRWRTACTFITRKKHPNPIQPVTKTTGSLFLEPGSGWPSPSEACFGETFASKNSSKERAGNRHTFHRGKPISLIFPLYGWTTNNKSYELLSNRLICRVTFLLCWPAFKTRPYHPRINWICWLIRIRLQTSIICSNNYIIKLKQFYGLHFRLTFLKLFF